MFHSFIRSTCIALCLSAVFASPRGSALVVLQYHHISTKTPAATSTSPALFAQHLAFLEEHQFSVISIGELPGLLAAARDGAALPDRTAVITFDDGYRSIYDTAWPLLKKRGWPFTVFVNSQPHDEKNPLFMTWAQLRELRKGGATIANHTDSHAHLIRKRDGETAASWRQRRLHEIRYAEQRINKEIGVSTRFFAFPFGEYDADLLRLLAEEGYLGFGQQSGPVAGNENPQLIPRFPLGGVYGAMDTFGTKMFSVPFVRLSSQVRDAEGRVLSNPELPAGENRPVLELRSPMLGYIKNVQCYASGQGEISVSQRGGGLMVRADRPLPVGRSRYNCTAHAGSQRYYWFSQLFIQRNSDGSWYRE